MPITMQKRDPTRYVVGFLVFVIVLNFYYHFGFIRKHESSSLSGNISDQDAAGLEDSIPNITPETSSPSSQAPLEPADALSDLTSLCSKTEWTQGLWLHCHSYCGANETSVCGGLNNARNRIQTCVRLAIDAGAGLILPSATTRDENNLGATNHETKCADHFWDVEFLTRSLGQACPQLRVRNCDDRSGIQKVIETPRRNHLDTPHQIGTFRQLVFARLEASQVKVSDVSDQYPVVVSFGDSYIAWNYALAHEMSSVRKALFKTLRYNPRLLDLSTSISRSPQLHGGKYIGVHLRVENDWPADSGSPDDAIRLYVEEIKTIPGGKHGDKLPIYVSCGNASAIQAFRSTLQPLGFEVHDKWTLLSSNPRALQSVSKLGFDQKAILEYQTLVRAQYWMGISTSSMSSLIAYARTMDNREDWFEQSLYVGSRREAWMRKYEVMPAMKGDAFTKMVAVDGVDIMEQFP